MIELQNLSKHYGATRAVDDVTLMVPKGSVTAIVGTSGSGKSTLLRLINGLIPPTAGEIRIDGRNTRDIPPHDLRRRIGYVIQDHGLFPHWSAARNIGCVPTLLGWPRARIRDRTDDLMRLLQLDPAVIGPRFPHELSGGQAQRVGVARALAAEPDLLLMDEPFGALDPAIRMQAQTDLAAIQKRLGTTILLITHDMVEAMRLADRIAVMRAGRIEQFGPPMDILAAPATEFVRSLVPDSERPFRILSLRHVGELAEAGASDGPPIPASATLGEALALMMRHDVGDLAVEGRAGHPPERIRRDAILAAGPA